MSYIFCEKNECKIVFIPQVKLQQPRNTNRINLKQSLSTIGSRIKRTGKIFVPIANHFICDRGSVISFCGFLLFDRRLIFHLFDKLDILVDLG